MKRKFLTNCLGSKATPKHEKKLVIADLIRNPCPRIHGCRVVARHDK